MALRYRILSMDGGGIRGLITAMLLQRLEQAQPGFLAQWAPHLVSLVLVGSTGLADYQSRQILERR
jgi:patatin-like phospholipase/acyl hydrolase